MVNIKRKAYENKRRSKSSVWYRTYYAYKEGYEDRYIVSINSLCNQAAIAAMQGVMKYFGPIDNKWTIAKLAVEQADELIKQLKEK